MDGRREAASAGLVAMGRAGTVVLVALVLLNWLCSSMALAARGGIAASAADAAAAPFGRPLVVGVTRGGWPPFNTVENGQLRGLGAAFLEQALRPDSGTLQVRQFDTLLALVAAACRGEVDVLPDVSRAPGREACLIYSEPYYEGEAVTAVRSDRQEMAGPTRAPTATYAVEDGFLMYERLRERYPKAKLLIVPDTGEALEAVAAGKADLYVGLRPSVEYELRQAQIHSVVMLDAHAEPTGELRFAFPRDQAALRDRIDAGLRRITADERLSILSQWMTLGFDAPPGAKAFVLSEQERKYLAGLGSLRAALTVRWAPFSYLDEMGRPVGILPAYLAYLSQTLGIRFEQRPQNSPAAIAGALQSGEADLIIAVRPDRPDIALHGVTQTLETYPVVIVGRRDESPVSSIAQLGRKRIALVQRAETTALLRAEVPSATVVETESLDRAMALVRDGQADVLLGNLAAVDQLLQKQFAGELKVLGATGYMQKVAFQVRGGLEPLLPIINRALAAMPESQRQAMRGQYLRTSYQLGLSWSDVARRAVPVALVAGLAIAALGLGYLRLRREVRKRKRSESELYTQLRFRSTLLDMVPFPIGVQDSDGVYVDINAASEEAIGMQREQIVGRTLSQSVALINPTGNLLRKLADIVGRTPTAEGLRVSFEDAKGHARHALYWRRQFFDESGHVAGAVAALVDITNVLEAEQKARETEALLEDVTRNLPAAVFQLRREPNGDLSYPYVGGNPALLPLTSKMGPSGLLHAVVHRDDVARLQAAFAESAETLRPVTADFRLGRDAQRWMQVHAVPQRDADGAMLWNGYWNDTTEEHRRTAELESARDAAESASVAKDQFLAMMSHEIRTPMSGVLGLIEVLAQTELKGEQGAMVGMIHDSAGALLQILDDILDFSKIQAAKLAIEVAPFDLRELCDLVLGLLSARAHEKGLRLRCRIAADVAALHQGDSVRLRQVLFNLLSNATKFTVAGSISLSVEVLREDGGRQALCIQVEDTGIGIEATTIPRLFSPFVQADLSTSRRFGGTGLGLSISNQLVRLMGGTLEMRSEVNAGTCVTVRLELPVERCDYDEPGLRGKHALVMVSDPLVARAMGDGLRALGMTVQLEDADTLLLSRPSADIVFLDDGQPMPNSLHGAKAIHVTERPKAAGYRLTEDTIRLSVNPLSMRGLRAVCHAAVDHAVMPDSNVAPEPLVASRTRDQAAQAGALILVVEDNPVNRYLIQNQLQSLGCTCDAVENGSQALEMHETNAYAIVVTDCHMPVVNGYDLAREIRAREGAGQVPRRTPIIGVTASVGEDERERCLAAGMDACLHKPLQLEVLRACLAKWAPGCLPEAMTASGDGPVAAAGEDSASVAGEGAGSAPLPPLDWQAIAASTGIPGPDANLVRLMVDGLRQDASLLPAMLSNPDPGQLRQWIHKVVGSASIMHYAPLLEALDHFRATVLREDVAEIRAAGERLQATLSTIAAHLEVIS